MKRKARKWSNRIVATPLLSMSYREMVQEALEPQAFWSEKHRDSRQIVADKTMFTARKKAPAAYREDIKRYNEKNRRLLQRRQVMQEREHASL